MLGEPRLLGHLARGVVDALHVARPSALRHQAAARPQDGVQAAVEQVVIGDPVERGGREHRVYGLLELQLDEVHESYLGTVSEALTRGLHHPRGAVHGDDPAGGQALEQHLGDPASPAAGVEHELVPLQPHARQDIRAPLLLWGGDAVV